MKFFNLTSLKKAIGEEFPRSCLLLIKEESERNQALRSLLKGPVVYLTPENFSQEVETLPFLSGLKILVYKEIDQLKSEELKGVLSYLKRPNPKVSLFLTASSLPVATLKKFEEAGHVLAYQAEKPWEKEKRLAAWLVDEAAHEGVTLPLATAQTLVKSVDSTVLKSELDKLICFVGARKKITLEDIKSISIPVHHETMWQLGDAIFERNTAQALKIGKILIEEGMAIFPLLAHLRTQIKTALHTLEAFQEGGREAVSKAFPYLKGGLLEKKLKLYQGCGQERLKRALVHLFEIELKAKNSAIEPELLLEILLSKLTNDTLSLAQSIRSC